MRINQPRIKWLFVFPSVYPFNSHVPFITFSSHFSSHFWYYLMNLIDNFLEKPKQSENTQKKFPPHKCLPKIFIIEIHCQEHYEFCNDNKSVQSQSRTWNRGKVGKEGVLKEKKIVCQFSSNWWKECISTKHQCLR